MASKHRTQNGSNRLEEAIALLIQNQANFASSLADCNQRHAEYDRDTKERFARIEADMAAILRVLEKHSQILDEHSRLLEKLPDALRDKIGFRPAQP